MLLADETVVLKAVQTVGVMAVDLAEKWAKQKAALLVDSLAVVLAEKLESE